MSERPLCQYCGHRYCICPAGTAALHARIAELEAVLDYAHNNLEDHGHEPLGECDCRIARLIRSSPTRGNDEPPRERA